MPRNELLFHKITAKGVRTILFFKKCKLLCCYDFFYLRHANLRKMGCGLTSSRSCLKVLMMIMMWCPSLMSRAKTKIPLTVHCLLINWLGSGLAGLNNFSNDEEVLTLVFSLRARVLEMKYHQLKLKFISTLWVFSKDQSPFDSFSDTGNGDLFIFEEICALRLHSVHLKFEFLTHMEISKIEEPWRIYLRQKQFLRFQNIFTQINFISYAQYDI